MRIDKTLGGYWLTFTLYELEEGAKEIARTTGEDVDKVKEALEWLIDDWREEGERYCLRCAKREEGCYWLRTKDKPELAEITFYLNGDKYAISCAFDCGMDLGSVDWDEIMEEVRG
jgi:hypothetical protein